MGRTTDVWASGDSYEPYVGRWSRLVAEEFVSWLPAEPHKRWLDVGCGTGALTEAILRTANPLTVHAVDRSEGYLEYARRRLSDPSVSFAVADARSLPEPDASHDVAVSGLVLNFVPEPAKAVAEMARVVVPGGIVAAYVWDYADGMQLMRYFWNAAVELGPEARELDEGARFPLCRPEPLKAVFRKAGLNSVEVRAIDVATSFQDFDDYWSPFLGGQGPAPSYAMSLSEERRGALRDQLRSALPVAPDGSIDLTARAWAVRGQPPHPHFR